MITLTNTKLSIPQGETGSITYYFKDYKTDAPLVLAKPEEGVRKIIFRVRASANNTAEEVFVKEYNLDKKDDGVTEEESTILDGKTYYINKEDFYQFENKDIIAYDGELKVNTLYKNLVANVAIYVFKKDSSDKIYLYTYDNSSLTITFKREDTVELIPKTYYYEIGYVVEDSDGNILIKET